MDVKEKHLARLATSINLLEIIPGAEFCALQSHVGTCVVRDTVMTLDTTLTLGGCAKMFGQECFWLVCQELENSDPAWIPKLVNYSMFPYTVVCAQTS